MKRGLILVVLLALGAVVFAFYPRQKQEAPLELDIQFTCDIHGRLVPCGCFTGQYGGMTRLQTALEHQLARNFLRVDVGDALAGNEDYSVMEYKYILQAFGGMKYDALNVGHREAQLSGAQLKALAKESAVPLLSANLLDKATGAPLLDGYRIVQRGNRRIAVLGVVDPRGLTENLGAGLALERMETALERLLPKVRPQADMIVLLAFTDEATLAELSREFYELDVVLGGRVRQPSQKLERENRSAILYVTNESRALGRLRARLSGRSQVEILEHEIMLLHDNIPEDATVKKLAADYRQEVRHARLQIDDPANLAENMVPGVRQSAAYVGSAQCASCHPGAAKVWNESAHAGAFAALMHKGADMDPNCIRCHTIGFGSATGYRREFADRQLVDVGCESCHGPGSLHVKERQAGATVTFKFRPLGAGDCQKCHYGEFSRPFSWDSQWPLIRHGTEARPVAAAAKKP